MKLLTMVYLEFRYWLVHVSEEHGFSQTLEGREVKSVK